MKKYVAAGQNHMCRPDFFSSPKKTYLALSDGSRKKMIESVADSFALIVAAAG